MFLGSSYLNLDVKGRIAIPTKYRDAIKGDNEGELVLTADHGGECLVLYPLTKWMDTQASIRKLPNMNKGVKNLMRTVFGYATEVKMDGQGRIMVSEPLRDFGKFDKKVVLVGQVDKFELWSEDAWLGGSGNRVDIAEESIENDDLLSSLSI
jgi:MraZ protein